MTNEEKELKQLESDYAQTIAQIENLKAAAFRMEGAMHVLRGIVDKEPKAKTKKAK